MTDYVDEVIAQARLWDDGRPRSRQTDIGLSSLQQCRSWLGFRISGQWPTDAKDGWRAIAGTSLHEWMAGLRKQACLEAGEIALFEVECEYAGIRGHADEVNFSRGEITDYKFPSLASARLWDDPEVQAERFRQVHLYAAGITATPEWKELCPDPEKVTVRMLVCPVDGTFADWRSYVMPFDQGEADAAIARFRQVEEAVAAGEELPKDKPFFFCRDWCEYFTACRGGGHGPVAGFPEITDPELAAAVEAYGEAAETARYAGRVKEALAPVLRGARGTARGWQVRMSRPGQDREVPDAEAMEAVFRARGIPVPVTVRPGRPAYLMVDRTARPPRRGA